jgi:hypothetical protein
MPVRIVEDDENEMLSDDHFDFDNPEESADEAHDTSSEEEETSDKGFFGSFEDEA